MIFHFIEFCYNAFKTQTEKAGQLEAFWDRNCELCDTSNLFCS